VWVAFNAPLKKDYPDKARLAALKNHRRAIKEFIGAQSEFDKTIEWMNNTVADSIYRTVGEGRLLNTWEMMSTSDPIKFMRSVAFHAKLGMFNPVQLFLQMQTLTHVMSLEGVERGVRGMSAARISDIAAINPSKEIKQALAQKAAAMGWNPRQFLEANEALARSGWAEIGAEISQLGDNALSPDLSSAGTLFGQAKEWSTVFFTTGERVTRKVAWFSAYERWRAANPLRALDDRGIQEIIDRADDLTVNMTRASNASWQSGLASVPTQFLSYQARLTEQFLGNKLTPVEKARAFLGHSLMYGIPVGGLGAPLGGFGWPLHEEIRKYMLENGWETDDNIVEEIANKGIVQTVWGVLGDEKDHNFAERYGPGGTSYLKDLVRGDKTIFELLSGIAGSVWGDALMKTEPVAFGMISLFSGEDDVWPLMQEDLNEAMSVISTWNNASKAIAAANLGKYISKNGVVMDDEVNGWDAMFSFLTGTQPQSLSDDFLKIESLQDQKQVKEEARKEFLKYFRLGIRKGAEGAPPEEAARYFKKAKAMVEAGGFTPMEHSRLLQQAYQGFENQSIKLGDRFSLQFPEAREQWIKAMTERRQRMHDKYSTQAQEE
jgi:hypothetical protein